VDLISGSSDAIIFQALQAYLENAKRKQADLTMLGISGLSELIDLRDFSYVFILEYLLNTWRSASIGAHTFRTDVLAGPVDDEPQRGFIFKRRMTGAKEDRV
jgi:hypothetical protein